MHWDRPVRGSDWIFPDPIGAKNPAADGKDCADSILTHAFSELFRNQLLEKLKRSSSFLLVSPSSFRIALRLARSPEIAEFLGVTHGVCRRVMAIGPPGKVNKGKAGQPFRPKPRLYECPKLFGDCFRKNNRER
jgi:hypothetical protein